MLRLDIQDKMINCKTCLFIYDQFQSMKFVYFFVGCKYFPPQCLKIYIVWSLTGINCFFFIYYFTSGVSMKMKY